MERYSRSHCLTIIPKEAVARQRVRPMNQKKLMKKTETEGSKSELENESWDDWTGEFSNEGLMVMLFSF